MWLSKNNEGRTSFCLFEDVQGVLDAIDVVRIADSQDVPSICKESCGDIFSEGQACVALDGDVVVVVDPAEIIETQMSRPATPLPKLRPPSDSHRRKRHKCCSRRFRSPAGCSGWRATFSAIAMPTLVATPCPRGPVVVSTPDTQWYSG